MVSITVMAGMVFAAVVAIGLPIAIYLVLRRRLELKFIPTLVGAGVFIVMVLVLEHTLHTFVLQPAADGSIALIKTNPAFYATYAVLAAGIFEETGRFVAFKLLRKRYQGVRTAISYGIGHGGIEAILLVGLNMVAYLALAVMINTGSGPALPPVVTDLLAQFDLSSLLLGGVERVFAIVIQLTLSVLVWVAATQQGKWWLYPVAIVVHALIDVPAVLLQIGMLDIVSVELIVAALAAVLAVVGWRIVTANLAAEKSTLAIMAAGRDR
ncbi:MAG: YhfC family intramembrane metalloprotease [Propionibacteriaceae bacterium]|jgi:uncharacterized membrane protein YhfC|nr:YhfC family intramembrane metalloprotease [Propionibacteriaceae bacterium]